jgi:hypothetical protein
MGVGSPTDALCRTNAVPDRARGSQSLISSEQSMEELERLIAEVHEWRFFHREQYRRGVRGAEIEAAACAIREVALKDAKRAILADKSR